VRGFAFIGLGILGVLTACGGSTTHSTATEDAGASTGDDAGVVAADAGVDAAPDPGSDVYPAPHHPIPQMTDLGGPVLKNIKVVTVTYVGEAERDMLRSFDDAIVQGAWWSTVSAGYGIGNGSSGGYVELPDDVSGKTIDDQDIQGKLYTLVGNGTLPKPDENTLYVLFFPAAATLTMGGSTGCTAYSWAGYHTSTGVNVNGATVEVAYAVIPDCGGGRTVTSSHEIIEAATDPHVQSQTAYYGVNLPWFGGNGGEVADVCDYGIPPTDVATGQIVSRSWSNGAAAASKDPCQPSPVGSIYFNVAIDTHEQYLTQFQIGTRMSEGYVTVHLGSSATVPLEVFSEAALPNDLQLSVSGVPQYGRLGTRTLPIVAGVTTSLSAATGRNGTHPTLTISADATTRPGQYKFVARALLDSTHYNTWPAILRVVK
jgi:hypothetical protein